MNPALLRQVIHQIQKSSRILVLPSCPPDGDSLGSAIALYLMLRKLNKQVTVVCADPIPESLQFLPVSHVIDKEFSAAQDFIVALDCSHAEVDTIRYDVEQDKVNIIITPKKGQFSEQNVLFEHGPLKYDLIITVDTGDIEQLGSIYENHVEMFYNIPVINIDHHASNSEFGKINLVDISRSSTTEILLDLLKEMDPNHKFIDADIVTALLAGVITDTGSFQNANTTPRSLETAAELVTMGARQQEIIKHVYKTKELSMLKLWGRMLDRIKFDENLRLVWSYANQEDFMITGSAYDQAGGIIDNLMTNTPGAEVVLLLKEKEVGLISGSVRTTNASVDASAIAGLFGGGGHVQAAGFRYRTDNFDSGVRDIIDKVSSYQKERLSLQDGFVEAAVEPASSVKEPVLPPQTAPKEAVLEQAEVISLSKKKELIIPELSKQPAKQPESIVVNEVIEKALVKEAEKSLTEKPEQVGDAQPASLPDTSKPSFPDNQHAKTVEQRIDAKPNEQDSKQTHVQEIQVESTAKDDKTLPEATSDLPPAENVISDQNKPAAGAWEQPPVVPAPETPQKVQQQPEASDVSYESYPTPSPSANTVPTPYTFGQLEIKKKDASSPSSQAPM